MTHDESREKEIKRIMTKEIEEPLWIRIELQGPRLIIANHRVIEEDPIMVAKYIEKQEQTICMRGCKHVKEGATPCHTI